MTIDTIFVLIVIIIIFIINTISLEITMSMTVIYYYNGYYYYDHKTTIVATTIAIIDVLPVIITIIIISIIIKMIFSIITIDDIIFPALFCSFSFPLRIHHEFISSVCRWLPSGTDVISAADMNQVPGARRGTFTSSVSLVASPICGNNGS